MLKKLIFKLLDDDNDVSKTIPLDLTSAILFISKGFNNYFTESITLLTLFNTDSINNNGI